MTHALSPDTEARAQALAAAQNRDVDALVEEAVRQYLADAEEAELVELKAISDKPGEALAHEDVVRWLKTWGADDFKPLGE